MKSDWIYFEQGGRSWQPFCEGKNADKNPEGWAE